MGPVQLGGDLNDCCGYSYYAAQFLDGCVELQPDLFLSELYEVIITYIETSAASSCTYQRDPPESTLRALNSNLGKKSW